MTAGKLIALAGLAAALPGCGGHHSKPAGPLSWDGKPSVFKSRGLPNDRVVIARVRNTSSHTLRLVGSKLVVRDATGRRLATTAAFTTTFAHGLYGALEQPAGGPPVEELYRLGKVAYLTAGSSSPFYAAWRLPPGARMPVRIYYGSGSLSIPNATATSR